MPVVGFLHSGRPDRSRAPLLPFVSARDYLLVESKRSPQHCEFQSNPTFHPACPFTSSRGEVPLSRTAHRRAVVPTAVRRLLFGGALRSGFWCLLWLCCGRGVRSSIGRTAIV